ncbi:MAG: adenylate/guanylate cyclase domain-containing protein [Desulfobacterota bacterium]|nr:adenylate/guanylate cyclase domain-containing protein [Thermodesulfobacteriota bacterium]
MAEKDREIRPYRKSIALILGIILTVIFCLLCLFRFSPLERLEYLIYDTRYHMHGKRSDIPEEIVIVSIDDRSIEKIGKWPWKRRVLAEIIKRLKDYGSKLIILDVILSEPERDDPILASAILQAQNVVLPIVFDMVGEKRPLSHEILLDHSFPVVKNSEKLNLFPLPSAKNVLVPVRELMENALALGHINIFFDADGVLRWENLAIEFDGEIFPSIDLQAARLFLGIPIQAMILDAAKGVTLGGFFIPTDVHSRILIHYYGPYRTFPYVSVIDLLEGKIEPHVIEGKICLVGAEATGIYDLRNTPVSPAMPGIEKHANVIASIIRGDHIRKVPQFINLIVIFTCGTLFTVLISKRGAIFSAILALIFFLGLLGLTYYLFFERKIWLYLSYPSVSILSIFFAITIYRYATEERHARRIKAMFSSYVTERVVNELIRNPSLAKLGGERKEVTVLFSDIAGFTSFSEKHDPMEVVSILNEYLSEMTKIIFAYEGTLDKFVGDEIVAFWNAPLPQENHAELALRCAIEMNVKLKELKKKWERAGIEPFNAGIGLNTGEVIVGNIGAEGKKMDYTVIGDNVNLGARIEGLTRKLKEDIIITENTLAKLHPLIESNKLRGIRFKGLGSVIVKGRTKPVRIYSVSLKDDKEPSTIEENETGVTRVYDEK